MNLKTGLKVLDNVSMSVDSNTAHVDCRGFTSGSFHFIWTGATAADGSFQVQSSNDPTKTFWEDKDGALVASSVGSGSRIVNVSSLNEAYLRVKFSKGSNTAGTVTCFFVGKNGGLA